MTINAEQARSFDAWADEYDRFRPTYPDAVFATIESRLELPNLPEVADLGAGTGRASLAEQTRFRDDLAALIARHHRAELQAFRVPYQVDLWISRRSGA